MKSLRRWLCAEKADWQPALNCVTFWRSAKRRLPIIAPVRQRRNNSRWDESGYVESGCKGCGKRDEGWFLNQWSRFPLWKWDSSLKLAWEWAVGWWNAMDRFCERLRKSGKEKKKLKKEADAQCLRRHKRSEIFQHWFPGSDRGAVGKDVNGVCTHLGVYLFLSPFVLVFFEACTGCFQGELKIGQKINKSKVESWELGLHVFVSLHRFNLDV